MKFKELEKELERFSKYVIQQARTRLTKENKNKGQLYKTLSSDIDQEKDAFLIEFLMEDYGAFVDKGVRGKTGYYADQYTSNSPFRFGTGSGPKGGLTKGIDKWLKKKKFQWRNEQGQFMSYKSMRYLIVKSIYNKGLKATMFFGLPYQRGVHRFSDKFLEAFALDIDKNLIFGEQ
jgi:hypothetical protein